MQGQCRKQLRKLAKDWPEPAYKKEIYMEILGVEQVFFLIGLLSIGSTMIHYFAFKVAHVKIYVDDNNE